MALHNDDDDDDDALNNTMPLLTLEEAYLVFNRLNPFYAAGAPTAAMIRRLSPDIAGKMFYGRQTLLHRCCCSEGYPERLDLIQALVQVYPKALEMYDSDGYWPLHYVVSPSRQGRGRFINVAVVEYLIQLAPLALLQTTRNRQERAIPLHLAVQNPSLTVPILNLLLQVFPETVHYRDAQGRVPIECAIQTPGLSIEVIQRLVDASPVLLSFVKNEQFCRLLLHRFVNQLEPVYDEDDEEDEETAFQSTPSIIRATKLLEILVHACPRALRVQTPRHFKTPLVLACQANVSVPCIYTLLRAWPEQVTTQRRLIFDDTEWNGVWLPTHLLQRDLKWRHVQSWLAQDQQAATAVDAAGRLALHYAVVTQASCAVALVRRLLQVNPGAIQHKDATGRLPLHYLALSTHDNRHELLDLLLSSSVENGSAGLAVQDKEGCLPWMYAELVHFTAVYEASLARGISLDHSEDLPSEVRWDIVEVVPEEDSDV